MAIAKTIQTQRDFSGGEADIALKRADDNPKLKAAARQMSNWRILAARGLDNRPGRRLLGLDGARVDQVVMSPGNPFYLVFGNTYLRVYNASFAKVYDSGNVMPWSNISARTIVWDLYRFAIYICFDGMQPQVLSWDGASQTSTWTRTAYAEEVTSGGQKRTPFYRLSPLGITCQPSPAVGGSVQQLNLTARGQFTQVPTVTIGAPGIGTTATATATLNMQSIAIANGGTSYLNTTLTGATLYLPDGVVLQVTGESFTFVVGGGFTSTVTSVSIVSQGSITSGATPANPVVATAANVSFSTAPSFNIIWQIDTLTLTNGGGSGYLTAPVVSFSPSGGATANATISSPGTLNTTISFSAGMRLTNNHIGTRIRYANRQILITGVTSPTTATGLIEESLYAAASFSTTAQTDLRTIVAIGQEVIGQTSGAKGIVVGFSPNGATVQLQYLSGTLFSSSEVMVGPSGSFSMDDPQTQGQAPAAITVWDEEVMNAYRGWPRACFIDQGRLGFCDFPALPAFIAWSANGDFTDLYTDDNNAGPSNAIQELAPGKTRVYYVVPGAEGSEFVFCDNAVYYIPINQSLPLKPGSVAFNTLMSEGAAQVQPRPVQQSIVYFSAGLTEMKAVQAIGAYNRPYIVDDISELHAHLLNAPFCIAAPGGSDQYEENYFYFANGDGSLVLVSFHIKNGILDVAGMGYLPWNGAGTATWISALKGNSDVIISSSYAPGGIGAVSMVEKLDATQYLDAAMLYNNVPAALTPPGGKGPLWFIAGGTVDLMDGLRMMGTYQVDANGFLVPQNNAGENFTSATLTAGQAWTATLEPFVPAVQPGQDAGQRLKPRKIARLELYVQNSSGYTVCRIFGGPVTRTSPAVGTIMSRQRIPAWNVDDDPTQAPPLREQAYPFRFIGRRHDPRIAIIKDTPGPLRILEATMEVNV